MKHPAHPIRVCIEGVDYVCNEFKTLHKGGNTSSCLIPSFPMTGWRLAWDIELLKDDTHPLPIYKIEVYVGGIQTSGSIYIDRRKKNEIIGVSPDLSRSSDGSMLAKDPNALVTKYKTQQHNPVTTQLIEVKIYEFHKKNSTRNPGQKYPPGLLLDEKLETSYMQANYLVVNYKFSYNFADKLRSSVNEWDLKSNRYLKVYPEDLPAYFLGSLNKHPGFSQMPTKSTYIISRRSRSAYNMFLRRLTGFNEGRSPLSSRVTDPSGVWSWVQRPAANQVWGPNHTVIVNSYRESGGQPVNDAKAGLDPDLYWLGRLKDYYPIPAGWEIRYTTKGSLYYVNHPYKFTTWEHPLLGCLENHKATARHIIEQELDLDQYSTESVIETPKTETGENIVGQQLECANKKDIVTQNPKETCREQRRPNRGGSPAQHLCSNNIDRVSIKLQNLRDEIDMLQIARAEVQDKHDVYLDGCEELSNWTQKYFQLWFPMHGAPTSPIHEKEVYLFNRSILFRYTVKELRSLDDQLVIMEEKEARLMDQLGEQETISFGSVEKEEFEEEGKKRKMDTLTRMAGVTHCLLPEFPLPNDEEIDTCIDSDLHRDKVLKMEMPPGTYTADDVSVGYDSGYYPSTSGGKFQSVVEGHSNHKSSEGSKEFPQGQNKGIAADNSSVNGDTNENKAAKGSVEISRPNLHEYWH